MTSAELRLRLLIDTKRDKVLFAEASKDVVDFLFSLLAMPVGTVLKLLTAVSKDSIAGGIANIYQSLEQLDETFLQPNQKNSLLDPVLPSNTPVNTILLLAAAASGSKRYYRCMAIDNSDDSDSKDDHSTDDYDSEDDNSYDEEYYSNCINYVTDTRGFKCPSCNLQMATEIQFVEGNASQPMEKSAGGGVLKGLVIYKIADDLTVTPMSTISSIVKLNSFNIKDLQGMELLRASLRSKTVLSDVFLQQRKTGNP